jgi:hypothetical protein
MSVPSIPQDFWFHFPDVIHTNSDFNGAIDANTTSLIAGDPARPIATLVIGDPNRPIATMLIGDPNRPISTDSKVELLNFPRLTRKDLDDLRSIRARVPNYSQVCFKLFGQEFFTICMNGETQIITEPYVPNEMEQCVTSCCAPDTRPFPDTKGFVALDEPR